jgi:hypothetical protein
MAGAAGIFTFILLLQLIFDHHSIPQIEFLGMVMPTFFIGGYVFAATTFKELQSTYRSYLLLMLPASRLEKLFVGWFISSLFYTLVSLLTMFVINLITLIMSNLLGNPIPLFNLFSKEMLLRLAIFLVTQPIFFLGAFYFRKGNFFKTILALSLTMLGIMIYILIVMKLTFHHSYTVINLKFESEDMPDLYRVIIPTVSKIFFWYIMAPFFLIVSYFSLKEREA